MVAIFKENSLLVRLLVWNLTKCNTPPWVLFMIPNRATHHIRALRDSILLGTLTGFLHVLKV